MDTVPVFSNVSQRTLTFLEVKESNLTKLVRIVVVSVPSRSKPPGPSMVESIFFLVPKKIQLLEKRRSESPWGSN